MMNILRRINEKFINFNFYFFGFNIFLEYGLSSENKEESFQAAMIIFSRLDEQNIIPSIYINHLDYDVLLNEALKLTVYIEEDDMSEASASLHLLKFAAQHIKDLQVPDLKNIF